MIKLLKRAFAIFMVVPIFPLVALAQTGTIQTFIGGINDLVSLIIPLLMALAVMFFIYNTVQYFVIQSSEEEGRKKAKQFMLYSLAAFVLIVALWGIVNFVIDGIGIDAGTDAVCPDYLDPMDCLNPMDMDGDAIID